MTADPKAFETRDLSVDGVLGPRGALSVALPGYEHRPGQLELARAIEAALADGTFLLAEAGTGTGKTLAYMVPAALSGKRVIISTATRTLQEQIVAKDLPLLRDEMGLELRAMMLKGRANYLCALKFEEFDKAPVFERPEDVSHWQRFRDWAFATESGDRADTDVPDNWGTWAQVSTTSEACLGMKCPHYDGCFVTRARRAAEECQLIIVNHALFFADLALKARGGVQGLGVLPSYDAVVFDEAHALEDVATEHFGFSASLRRLTTLADDAITAIPSMEPRAAALSAMALTVKTRAEALFRAASEVLIPSSEFGGVDARLGPESMALAKPAATALIECLAALAALCPEDDTDLEPIHRRSVELAEGIESVVDAADPALVFWAQLRGRGGVVLRSAPIDVGKSLDEHLYGSVDSAIFTSATLTSSESFSYAVERLGLSEHKWKKIRVDSPFDYPNQAALYVPRHLPEPSSPDWTREFAREVLRLVRLTKGRAFVLFTSLRHMDEVHALLAPHLPVQGLKQGDAPRRALLESFHAQPSVLFASHSFWEGVDVPGDALSLVVIDRLPFAPPGEPLQAARMEAVRARGGAPFDEFQVPQAALALRQGFGRLIRSSSDRGIVAIGDVRLITKRYGKTFLQSLPPARRIGNLEELRQWWEPSSS